MSRVGTLALLTAAKLLPPNKSKNMHFNGGLQKYKILTIMRQKLFTILLDIVASRGTIFASDTGVSAIY